MNSAITEGHFYFMKELRGKITETDSKTACQELEEMGYGEFLFNWYKVSIMQDEYILEIIH